MVCNDHHHTSPDYFLLAKQKLYTHKTTSCHDSSLYYSPWLPSFYFLSLWFLITLSNSHKWNHILFVFFWLVYFSQHKVHSCCDMSEFPSKDKQYFIIVHMTFCLLFCLLMDTWVAQLLGSCEYSFYLLVVQISHPEELLSCIDRQVLY